MPSWVSSLTVPGGPLQTPLTVSCLPECGALSAPCLHSEEPRARKRFLQKLEWGVGGRQGSEPGQILGRPAGLPGHHHSHYCLSSAFCQRLSTHSFNPAIIHSASAKTPYIPWRGLPMYCTGSNQETENPCYFPCSSFLR